MTRTSPVRIGVIGLGAIGERLIRGFEMNQDTVVAAVCDTQAERVQQVAKQLGGIQGFTSHKDLLANADLDYVYIAVPPKFHHDIALDVLAAGKNVLCEKPLANSVPEAAEMLEAAKKAGVITAMNFPMNYERAMNKFASLYEAGYIGKLDRLELTLHFPLWPRAWQQNPWVGGREQGGFVLEVGVHYIQLLQRVFGPITRVKSNLEFPDDPSACETSIDAQMELADGTLIHIDGKSPVQSEEHISLTAFGDKGRLSILNWATLQGAKNGEPVQPISTEDANTPGTLMDNIVLALDGKQAAIFDFAVGYNAQVVLEALRHPQHDDWVDLTDKLAK